MGSCSGVTPIGFSWVGVTLRVMPTKNPRIYLTVSPDTLGKLDALCVKLEMTRPQVLRAALKALAKAKL